MRLFEWALILALAVGSASPVLASQASPDTTPFAVPPERHCVLDLDAPDIVIELEIGDSVPAGQFELIEWIVDRRIQALGVTACTIDRFDERIAIAMQTSLRLTRDEFEALLIAHGRIELVDPAGDQLVVGNLVRTSSSLADTEPTPVAGAVYETIITNADIVSITPALAEIGGPVAQVTLTEDGHARLAAYASSHIGEVMPLVVDGVVILAPVIRGSIPASFDLQPVDFEVTQRLAVYAAALPYPEPLTMTGFVDLRTG